MTPPDAGYVTKLTSVLVCVPIYLAYDTESMLIIMVCIKAAIRMLATIKGVGYEHDMGNDPDCLVGDCSRYVHCGYQS